MVVAKHDGGQGKAGLLKGERALSRQTTADLWKLVRTGLTDRWATFKQTCLALAELRQRFASDDRLNKSRGHRRREFFAAVKREVGFSQSYTSLLILVARNQSLMYLENSVAARIDLTAAIELSRAKAMKLPHYKAVLQKVKQRAVLGGEVVSAEQVRHWLYPRSTRLKQFKAASELGRLLYVPKDSSVTEEAVLSDIRAMLESRAIYGERKRRLRRTSRRARIRRTR